jgi:uncharacterized protein YggE
MQTRIALAGAAVVAGLLVTAGIAGALTTGQASGPAQVQNQQSMSDTITVSGSGQVQAEADRAVVEVAVLATGDDIGTVRSQLSANTSSMRDALRSSGVDNSQIRTNYYDISSQDRYGGPREEEPQYQAVHSFTITVDDPDDVGEVIDTAVSNGASEIDGVEFTLSAERREDLREDALDAAMDNARSDASTVAGAEDIRVSGVDRISTTNINSRPFEVQQTALAGGDGGGTAINSGPVTVSASVTVVYETSS